MKGLCIALAAIFGVTTWIGGVSTFITFWTMVVGGAAMLLGFDVPVSFTDLVIYWAIAISATIGAFAAGALSAFGAAISD